MGVPAELQTEAISIVHQFLQNIDKSLAQEFLKKTKAVSALSVKKPRVTGHHTCSKHYNTVAIIAIPSYNSK